MRRNLQRKRKPSRNRNRVEPKNRPLEPNMKISSLLKTLSSSNRKVILEFDGRVSRPGQILREGSEENRSYFFNSADNIRTQLLPEQVHTYYYSNKRSRNNGRFSSRESLVIEMGRSYQPEWH